MFKHMNKGHFQTYLSQYYEVHAKGCCVLTEQYSVFFPTVSANSQLRELSWKISPLKFVMKEFNIKQKSTN